MYYVLQILHAILFGSSTHSESHTTDLYSYNKNKNNNNKNSNKAHAAVTVVPVKQKRILSSDEINELVYYEELDYNDDSLSNPYNTTVRSMYNKVPLNPFKATVRTSKASKLDDLGVVDLVNHSAGVVCSYNDSSNASTRSLGSFPQALEIVTTADQLRLSIQDNIVCDSPASFPATPFSRAYVMNRSTEKVTSVMFAARDVLRLEAQSVSKDDYSRQQAKEAQSSGQFAIFDPRQSSSGLSLTCGNHCVMKVGQGQCSCCRSMIPIHTNTYVYFEFSVTVSGYQAPTLGIGLTPPDAPLNTMIGSWPRSVGLYSDGQVLIGSRWYQSRNGIKIQAGSTVGMLVYLPSSNSSTSISEHQSLNTAAAATATAATNKQVDNNDVRSDGSSSSSHNNNNNNNPNNSDKNNIQSQSLGRSSSSSSSTIGNEELLYFHFTLDGVRIDHGALEASSNTLLHDIVELNTPLFPTVGIFSMDTRVWCRFCEADIVYRSRQAIGAIEGVRVYCLDGSVLLQDNEN